MMNLLLHCLRATAWQRGFAILLGTAWTSLLPAQTPGPGPGVTLRVPQDFATIQQAINVAPTGATVLVTMTQDYNESPVITKNIKVTAKNGPGKLRGRFQIQSSSGGPVVNANMVLSNFTIENPATETDGGGILVVGAHPVISKCTVQNCRASNRGGGIAVFQGGPQIRTCKFILNQAVRGGGVYLEGLSPTMINSFVSLNAAVDIFAAGDGGGVYIDSAVVTVRNCTITGNAAGGQNPGRGGGIYATGASSGLAQVFVQNTILWDNAVGINSQQLFVDTFATVEVSHSDVLGGQAGVGLGPPPRTLIWGPGNINAHPLFTDGLHIPNFSPCINAGNTSLVTIGETDIDMQARVFSIAVDIGCDEFVIAP
jgi:hypothetical protein